MFSIARKIPNVPWKYLWLFVIFLSRFDAKIIHGLAVSTSAMRVLGRHAQQRVVQQM